MPRNKLIDGSATLFGTLHVCGRAVYPALQVCLSLKCRKLLRKRGRQEREVGMRFELSIRRRKASVGSRCRGAVTVSGAQIIMHHEGRLSVPGFLVFSSTPDEATTNSRCRITNEELPSSLFVGIKPGFRFACSPCGVNSLRALPCRNLLADSVPSTQPHSLGDRGEIVAGIR